VKTLRSIQASNSFAAFAIYSHPVAGWLGQFSPQSLQERK